MKIIDVCESYSDQGGGVRTYVHHKMAAGVESGHEVVVIAPGEEDREEQRGSSRFIFVKSPRSPFDKRYGLFNREKAIHDILDREKPDVVEGSSPWGGGWFAGSWMGDAVKSFVFHTDAVAVWPQTFVGHKLGFDRVDRLFKPYWNFMRKLSSRYDATVVSGDWLEDRLRNMGVHRPYAVPFGIDKQQFSPAERDEELRQDLLRRCGMPAHASLVIIVSRLDPEKRVGTLLKAFKKASESRPMGLVVFGRGSLQRYYGRQIEKTPGACWGGYVSGRDEMARLFASADLFLHGSAAETYGLVVAEALCSGLPVVVPSLGGAADLAFPGCSETYQAGDPESCSAAILALLARDRGQVRHATRHASAEIGTMAGHFRDLFCFYEGLVERPATERINTALRADAGASRSPGSGFMGRGPLRT
jgi:alpha-1,6-mannosyltransferase